MIQDYHNHLNRKHVRNSTSLASKAIPAAEGENHELPKSFSKIIDDRDRSTSTERFNKNNRFSSNSRVA